MENNWKKRSKIKISFWKNLPNIQIMIIYQNRHHLDMKGLMCQALGALEVSILLFTRGVPNFGKLSFHLRRLIFLNLIN